MFVLKKATSMKIYCKKYSFVGPVEGKLTQFVEIYDKEDKLENKRWKRM